jgi:diguanylate cyclase (GGDEF)-like protein/PAS domain S-box-containing protein
MIKRTNAFFEKRVDNFYLLLLFFSLLLIALFVYLEKINTDIQYYRSYQHVLHRMLFDEKDLENTFLRTFRYTNYDQTEKTMQNCEEELDFFKNSKIAREFSSLRYKDVLTIEKLYKKKRDLVERFQSANARATNAIHYLYDLRKTIRKKYQQNVEINQFLDQFFFYFGRTLMNLPVEKAKLAKDMKRLEALSKENKYLFYFYRQSRQFMNDVALIHSLIEENEKIPLLDTIEDFSEELARQYEENLFQQRIITLSFFVLAFLILLILFYQYRRVRRTSLELRAFRYAIENSDNSVVITDPQRHILYANEAFEEHSGYKIDEVLGHNPNVLKSNMHSEEFYRSLNATLDRGEKWQGELINKRKDGSLLYEKASIMPIIVDGKLEQYLAIKLDITEYIEQQKRLQQAAAAFETIGEGILILDTNKRVVMLNPALERIFGYGDAVLQGREPIALAGKEQESLATYKRVWDAVEAKGQWSGRIDAYSREGKRIPVWLTVKAIRNAEGEIENYIAVFTDLEEIFEMQEQVDFLAYHDSLTRLPNRVYIERELPTIFELAVEKGKRVALLFIDLDRFKVINDTLGHNIGDSMLVVLADRLRQVVRKEDLLARFGGDEFVVVMSDVNSQREVSRLAVRLLEAIREPIIVGDYHLNTTASIGIALFPDDGKEISVVVKHADAAMYHAKERGKDNYWFYSSQLSVDMQRRLDLEQKLLHALEREELSLVYQPQYDLKSREVCGVEALLRWHSSELGFVPPDQFIPIAEETGMIVKIGYFVIEEAIKAYMQWKGQGIELEWVAVNLSSIQFRQDDWLERFGSIIERTGMEAQHLELEITERWMMEYTQKNLDILNTFNEMGCRISIDDFGTGYSSMSYLKSFSVDSIKIDKSFVDHLPKDSNSREVSTAIIALSHSLGYRVVAEGIETKAQEDFLRKQGCNYGQGYYFSRPLSSDAFTKFMQEYTPDR